MKVLVSLIALFALVSCGKKFEDRAQEGVHKDPRKGHLSSEETWVIHSERPLPARIKVLVNDMLFVNECKGVGHAEIVRNYNNGSISIPTRSTFRQEYFDIDIFDCQDGSEFFSGDYIDQSPIVDPKGSETIIVLRLRND